MKSLHLDNWLLHPLFAPLLLAVCILAVYFPSISSGLHTIDDPGIFALFSSPPPLNVILLPGHSYYYRPVIELSFYVDGKLWGMEPSVMHLENILLHLANTLLVFLISRQIASRYPGHSPLIPLLAALLFALHPLNVEAVSWIAGRTDPLAAFFVLFATLFWLRWLDDSKWRYVVCTLVLFGFGVLTKESALAILPVYLLFVLMWPGLPARRRLIAVAGTGLSFVLVIVVAALLWKHEIVSHGQLLAANNSDITAAARKLLTAFGFYVKKMLIPLPLNFAITEVDSGYALLGVLSIAVLAAALLLWRLNVLFFAASALMILPALIVSTKQIAWTPLAERYLYMPTAFFCLGTACLLFSIQKSVLNRIVALIVIVICVSGIASFKRNLLWGDKLAFYQDAVVKSPGFGSVFNELGVVLLKEGQFDKAAEAFAAADRLNTRPSMKMLIKSNMMATMLAKGDLIDTREYFFHLFGDKKSAPYVFLEILYTADGKRLESIDKSDKVPLAHDLLETLRLLYLKKPDPFWLYRSGQIALVAGETSEAADFFRRAYTGAPLDSHYKAAAKTYYQRLEAGQ